MFPTGSWSLAGGTVLGVVSVECGLRVRGKWHWGYIYFYALKIAATSGFGLGSLLPSSWPWSKQDSSIAWSHCYKLYDIFLPFSMWWTDTMSQNKSLLPPVISVMYFVKVIRKVTDVCSWPDMDPKPITCHLPSTWPKVLTLQKSQASLYARVDEGKT